MCSPLWIIPYSSALEMVHNRLLDPTPLGSAIPQLLLTISKELPRGRLAAHSLLITLSSTGHIIQGDMKSCTGNTQHVDKIMPKFYTDCDVI
jgi:hypothetical protein